MSRVVVGAAIGAVAILAVLLGTSSDGGLDLEQGFRRAHQLERTLSLTAPLGDLSAADLRPAAGAQDKIFVYRYRLAAADGGWMPPLVVAYADDAPAELAFGWSLEIELPSSGQALALPVLQPAIEVSGSGERLSASWESHQWPATPGSFAGGRAVIVELDPARRSRLVLAPVVEDGPVAPIAVLEAGTEPVHLAYELEDGALVLRSLRRGDRRLRFERDAARSLEALVLDHVVDGGSLGGWRFRYRTDGGIRLLEEIAVLAADGGERRLRFAYGRGPAAPATGATAGAVRGGGSPGGWRFRYRTDGGIRLLEEIAVLAADGGERRLRFAYGRGPDATTTGATGAPVWERIEGDPRFATPERLAMSVTPGLRFLELNDDGRLDLVVSDRRRQRAWLRDDPGWREISYRPPSPSVDGLRPLGAQLVDFSKHYFDRRLNTDTFPALLVSRYHPDPDDPERLAFRSEVCFPPVRNGRLGQAGDPENWDCDCSRPLRLPVPLQFEGRPWPTHLPGIAAVERRENQGARIVSFELPLHLTPQLFYIGQRYRDAGTGEVLLAAPGQAPFRDTGNCRRRTETLFVRHGESRRVLVDTCQAFWQVSARFWHQRDSDAPSCRQGTPSSFWRRLDLDAEGRPNGRFLLPWHDDPGYHYHYEHFRGVRFPRLRRFEDRFAAVAVVQGRGGGAGGSDPRPPARDLYGLLRGRWRWQRLPETSPYRPPAPFFDELEGQFLDLDGDGDDDAVDARGTRRLAYLNELDSGGGWRERPDYLLPRECDLGSGHCQPVDLDADEDLDLLIGNGRTVFLNRSRELGRPARLRMTAATSGRVAQGVEGPASRTVPGVQDGC